MSATKSTEFVLLLIFSIVVFAMGIWVGVVIGKGNQVPACDVPKLLDELPQGETHLDVNRTTIIFKNDCGQPKYRLIIFHRGESCTQ